MASIIPKLKLPFCVLGGAVQTVEQDSIDELGQTAYAILATEIDSRDELPEFGIPDQSNRKGGANFDEIREAIETWEPRIEQGQTEDEWEAVLQKVRVIISD